jgi:hypothetical protein
MTRLKLLPVIACAFALLLSSAALNTANAQPAAKKASAAKKDDRPSPPAEANGTIGDLNVQIKYSQPGVKGRNVWGELVPYGKVWRTGANEATTIELSRDCKVAGKMLRAGKYSLFTIPGEQNWTIIFNTVADQWGAYKYDESKDALRITDVKPGKSSEFNERLKFDVKASRDEGEITLSWDNLKVSFPIR